MTPNMHINALREQVLALEAEIERLQAAIAWTREVRPGKNAESGGAIVHMTWDQFNTMRAIARAPGAQAMTREPDIVARLRAIYATHPMVMEAADEIERLEAVCHDAFMAMCAFRDGGDGEALQDAIDLLGIQSNLAWDDPRRALEPKP